MCVSMWPADFTGTILYTGRRRHPEHGWIDVLGYQNTAANLGPARTPCSSIFLRTR